MKRAMVLLSVISIIFISFSPILAQTWVDNPALPEGYAAWPYTKTTACGNVTETIWARTGQNSLEYVLETRMSGELIAYEYLMSDSAKPKSSSVFLKQDDKWIKFNGMNNAEYNIFLGQLETMLKIDGNSDACLVKLDDELNDLLSSLLINIRSQI